jgi:hypothetical protein
MSFEVLTLESLDKISAFLKENPADSRVATAFDEIEDELELNYVPVAYNIAPDVSAIVIPGNGCSELESDKKNVSIVYEALKPLGAAHATDERLWATLAIKYLSDYTLARWPLPKDPDKVASHVSLHWMCKSGVRSRARDNSVSRLWWMGRLVHQLDGWQTDQVVEILFNNSDYRANIVERSSSVSAANVVGAILAITDQGFKLGKKFDRSCFRQFMKEVNYHAGRTNLAALSEVQLIHLLQPIYENAYNPSKKKATNDGLLKSLAKKLQVS